mmetsp:Transcript_116598/g.238509  ORF Transcript_116598/g.238509 Transcript_116598/m.238509 type:complete len:91 (+) Transcript_116598:2-274(+)
MWRVWAPCGCTLGMIQGWVEENGKTCFGFWKEKRSDRSRCAGCIFNRYCIWHDEHLHNDRGIGVCVKFDELFVIELLNFSSLALMINILV